MKLEQMISTAHSVVVKARHMDWTGYLRLNRKDRSILHVGVGSTGVYTIENDHLFVIWDRHGEDRFRKLGDQLVHVSLFRRLPQLCDLFAVSAGTELFEAKRISLSIGSSQQIVTLRCSGSDIPTFHQIFVDRTYDSPNLPANAKSIVDLGANVGLATVFLGLRYPDANILAVEPDISNFAVLLENIKAFGARVKPLQAAAWIENVPLELSSESGDGVPLESWGLQTKPILNTVTSIKVDGYDMQSLLSLAQFDQVDILKIDIEGAERELFTSNAGAWLPRVKLLIVETHDRFHAGCEIALRNALSGSFRELPRSGESQYYERI